MGRDSSSSSRRKDERNDDRHHTSSSSSSSSSSSRSHHSSSSSKRKRYDKREDDKETKKRRTSTSSENKSSKDSSSNKSNDSAPAAKQQPISVENLLKKRKEEEQQQSKPVFLSKKDRERLAIERRKQQVEEQKRKREEERQARRNFLKVQEEKDANEERERRSKRNSSSGSSSRNKLSAEEEAERLRQQELQEIKNHYLGKKRKKRKVIKPTEKYQYVFNWDMDDDTSKDLNPIYSKRVPYKPAFGKGFMAGIDQEEQVKEYQKHLTGKKKKMFQEASSNKLTQEASWQKIKKTKHWTEKSLSEMKERDWRIFREDHSITTRGGSIPVPMRDWSESGLLSDSVLKAIAEAGYEKPTPIQMQAIPIGLQNRDILGMAETGSGKTAAFVIPMLEYISRLPKITPQMAEDGPYALILAPTRELAQQIEIETKKFANYLGFRTACLVGGQSIEDQGFKIRQGVEIIIAAPGRLLDCLQNHYAALNQCNYVVLDEADQLVAKGFEEQITSILDDMPSSQLKSTDEEEAAIQEIQASAGEQVFRTTTLYSATMPAGVERLARKYLRRPAQIAIGEVGRAVDRITQRVEFVKNDNDKKNKLIELLISGPPPPVMIFMNTKKGCDSVARYINGSNIGGQAIALHSSKSQDQRMQSLADFKSGRYGYLVATDVAGRGIDVKGVTHVINFDAPKSIQDYTHRCGRTARAGEDGMATTFLTAEDTHIMYELKQMLVQTNNQVPAELARNPASNVKPGSVDQKRRDTVIYTKT